MGAVKKIGKREFIQYTSRYLNLAEKSEGPIVITHRNKPCLKLVAIKSKPISALRGLISKVTVRGDINDSVLPGYEQW